MVRARVPQSLVTKWEFSRQAQCLPFFLLVTLWEGRPGAFGPDSLGGEPSPSHTSIRKEKREVLVVTLGSGRALVGLCPSHAQKYLVCSRPSRRGKARRPEAFGRPANVLSAIF